MSLPTYHFTTVNPSGLGEFKVHHVEAGDSSRPKIVLLHGFPSSSTQYRDLIPLLSPHYHVLAPDLPSYGLTESPSDITFTFDVLAAATMAWLDALKIDKLAVYVFDYGAPTGWRLCLSNKYTITAIITQNGNAYEEGFGHPFWDPVEALWTSNNDSSARKFLVDNLLTLDGTKMQYYMGPSQDHALVNPMQWTTDYWMNIFGEENQKRQLDLFWDYRTWKELYPKIQAWFREKKVPVLVVWGRHDTCFIPPGAEAFKKDLPEADVRFVEAGHFALETKREEIAKALLEFLKKNGI